MKRGLVTLMRERRAAGALRHDDGQEEALVVLDALLARLPAITRPPLWPLQRRPKNRGVYLYGPVGRGKTMLMDMFFEQAVVPNKKRVHFHAFMLDVHRRLHALRAQKGEQAIMRVARAIAKEASLLCFDEFQVHNIADAMILSRLFRALFRAGVAVVITSNVAPEHLYRDGLQRALFLPFIDVLKKRLTVMAIGTGEDHRQRRLKGKPVYFVPHDARAREGLQRIFDELTDRAEPESMMLEVDGRRMAVPHAARGVAWFSFSDLCRNAVGPADYLMLTRHFHTLLLEDVPSFTDRNRDETLRFIHLVDCLYDTHTKLAVSAAAEPDHLIDRQAMLAPQFERTASRLSEMRSEAYLLEPQKEAEYKGQKA